jgi:hypothetical protein
MLKVFVFLIFTISFLYGEENLKGDESYGKCLKGDQAECIVFIFSLSAKDPDSTQKKQTKEIISKLDKFCKNGDLSICNQIGLAYFLIGDIGKSIEYHKIGCDKNHDPSCYNLASRYIANTEKPDFKRAYTYYEKACEAGKKDQERIIINYNSSDGCVDLGIMHMEGEGVPVDIKKAEVLFVDSCKRGNARGCELIRQILIKEEIIQNGYNSLKWGDSLEETKKIFPKINQNKELTETYKNMLENKNIVVYKEESSTNSPIDERCFIFWKNKLLRVFIAFNGKVADDVFKADFINKVSENLGEKPQEHVWKDAEYGEHIINGKVYLWHTDLVKVEFQAKSTKMKKTNKILNGNDCSVFFSSTKIEKDMNENSK